MKEIVFTDFQYKEIDEEEDFIVFSFQRSEDNWQRYKIKKKIYGEEELSSDQWLD
jgi:hypothetical protein